MARTNTRSDNRYTEKTHEGVTATRTTALQELRRSVLSCMLFEDTFYEGGVSIADRIEKLAESVAPEKLAELAIAARSQYNLRHAPLLLLTALLKTGAGKPGLVANTIYETIQRPDELTELVSLYWRNGKKPLTGQLKKGLARAFGKFSEYSLAKYDQDTKIKLRDILFLTHARPINESQKKLFDKVTNRELKTPDTWEVALSGGADKKATFERLIKEGKLGYFALLRNLRNMAAAGCDHELVNEALLARKNGAERILPFRFIAAAKAAPQFEPALDAAMQAGLQDTVPRLTGRTIVLIDVSGSMDANLSGKSDLTRMDAAAALGAIVQGDLRLFTFSNEVREVPARKGMAGVEAIKRSQPHGGTRLGAAIDVINKLPHDRLIVITDEQTTDRVGDPVAKLAYLINVGSYKNGISYSKNWVHLDGFSERVLSWISEFEEARSQL